jgi:hypothetical protein
VEPEPGRVRACVLQYLAILMALLRWFQRKGHEVVPKTYVTPDPAPYWVFRAFQVREGEEADSEEKASAA